MTVVSKGDNMINETLLTKDEAISFLDCMYDELYRHRLNARESDVLHWKNLNNKVKAFFWQSSTIRHHQDCDMILKTIEYLEEKYNLKPRVR